jgi:hypothetical protein
VYWTNLKVVWRLGERELSQGRENKETSPEDEMEYCRPLLREGGRRTDSLEEKLLHQRMETEIHRDYPRPPSL